MNQAIRLNFPAMPDGELEACLLIEEGAIEAYRHDSLRLSKVFWKAVENRIKILAEMRKRKIEDIY